MAHDGTGGEHGNFFAVDRRSWEQVCGLGLNPAVAYLVLAAFSQANNRTTAASTNAIEKYTGISRGRAKEAIQKLIAGRLLHVVRAGTYPRYELVTFEDIAQGPRITRTPAQQAAFERARAGERLSGAALASARELVRYRWLREDGKGLFSVVEREPEWIWLPKALVEGADTETPPVERIRQLQEPMLLRLFIDLYYAQLLREDGGIRRNILWKSFEKKRIGQNGANTVWGFREISAYVRSEEAPLTCHRREPTPEEKEAGKNVAVDIFKRLGRLEAMRLLKWVPHLFESDSPEAEPIHPLGVEQTTGLEDQLGLSACIAAGTLLLEEQIMWTEANGFRLVVPVFHHQEKVAVLGIARLTYRPRTKMTAAWWANLHETGRAHLERYNIIYRAKAG